MLVPTKRFPRSGDQINLQHPLCRGLRFLTFFDSAKPNNLGSRTGIQPTIVGAPTVVTSPYGPAMRFVRASSQRLEYPGLIMTVGTPISCLVYAKITIPPNNFGGHIIGNRGAGTTGWLLQSVQVTGSGIVGVRWLANGTGPIAMGGTGAFDRWGWFGGQMINSGSSSCRSYLEQTVSTDTACNISATTQPFMIGGSGGHTVYASMDIAFAMVSEANLSQAEMRQWMNFEWPMFRRNTMLIYDDNYATLDDDGVTAQDDLTVSTAGPLELNDDGISASVEAGGSVSTTPPSTGPLELSDNASADTGTTTVEEPTVIATVESAAAASTLSIPNPLSLTDNAFAGSKATTILNSNPGILASGRYRG